jgi:general stress protein CsbA
MDTVKALLWSVKASGALAGCMGIAVAILLVPAVLFGQRDRAWWVFWDVVSAVIGFSSLFGLRRLLRETDEEDT